MPAYKPDLGVFRFQTFRIEHLVNPDCDPNDWLIDRDSDYIVISTSDGKIVDELEKAEFSILTDLSLICYAVGWMHASAQVVD